ncbi:(R)-mandelonitrile lyase [Mucilaginibacter lappiensis]|uniref:Quercetin dioxygenase-like cupin family protein n=1 Tax=Mucilaginibacter lappiensis TaxID=354630 RepID=A0A841JML7_9SPHI|nr:cupin domain-containing protein [Mucilaginibacter lappiensis]MBB6130836.1 quercetin dioxygenase-like cupin family protein [Mucilaginibacter lappiensis]
MKKLILIIACLAGSFQNGFAQSQAIFPEGERGSAQNFTGTVWVHVLVPNDSTFNCSVGNVTFEPGARSFWHTHQAGQILLVTDGTGYTQEKGKPVKTIHKGDVIICKPGVEHWHGAAPGSAMTHISINTNTQNGVVTWLQSVTDQDYPKQ